MTPRSRSLAWDATTAIEALAAAETALWVWTPAADELRFTGATRSLGLGPLAPECTAAGFVALAMPQDRSLAERMLKPQDEGAEIAGTEMGDSRLPIDNGVESFGCSFRLVPIAFADTDAPHPYLTNFAIRLGSATCSIHDANFLIP